MKSNEELSIPNAAPLINSLRSIGYDLNSAIADIIDNSIDAKANTINIDIVWGKNGSYIRIQDNGTGMNQKELKDAMRLGSKNPYDQRSINELGRFGMGLKTAAFSLGKRLSVFTKKDQQQYTRCWDLEYIEENSEWIIFKEPRTQESLNNLGSIDTSSGTVVLIEILDRVIKGKTEVIQKKNLLNKVGQLRLHLAAVFHKFLEGPKRLKMILNNAPLEAWDPFGSISYSTQTLAPFINEINGSFISISPYILPHHSNLTGEQFKLLEGPKGWTGQQGFYIYRNKRLLTSGTWLGLFPKEEATKLARIEIDLQNDTDFNWNIDIKKSKAAPPPELIDILRKIGNNARKKSHEVYYQRTITGIGKNPEHKHEDFYWEQVSTKKGTMYRINNKHNLLKEIKDNLDNETRKKLEFYLVGLEEFNPSSIFTIPSTTNDCEELTDSAKQKLLVIIDYAKQMLKSEDVESAIEHIKMYDSLKIYSFIDLENFIRANW